MTRILRVHVGKPKYYHRIIGGNFRLDTIRAAVLDVKLNYLVLWTKQRQDNAKQYVKLSAESRLVEKAGIHLPEAVYEKHGVRNSHIYNQFVIRAPRRDALREYLKVEGISTEVYYPLPFHLQECFQSLGYKEGNFSEAERAAREKLSCGQQGSSYSSSLCIQSDTPIRKGESAVGLPGGEARHR